MSEWSRNEPGSTFMQCKINAFARLQFNYVILEALLLPFLEFLRNCWLAVWFPLTNLGYLCLPFSKIFPLGSSLIRVLRRLKLLCRSFC